MPELPEVESIRRSLAPRIVGRCITAAVLHRRDVLVVPGDPYGGFSRQRGPATRARPRRVSPADLLAGATVTALERRGKQLVILGSRDDRTVLGLGVQLGMSGQLFHRAVGQTLPQSTHVHAVWTLDNGSRLIFRDPRRFGGLRSFPTQAAIDEHWARLGPDALEVTADQLAAALADSRRAIKAALLDQRVVAGVGNIYADEALFAAAIRPARRADRLRPADLDRLAAAIRGVLAAAVSAGGSTLRDYVDADGNPGTFQLAHAVYGRTGQPCPACGRPLAGGRVAQRATAWCRSCQR